MPKLPEQTLLPIDSIIALIKKGAVVKSISNSHADIVPDYHDNKLSLKYSYRPIERRTVHLKKKLSQSLMNLKRNTLAPI